MDEENSLDSITQSVLKRIYNAGRATQLLNQVLDLEVFDNLSKHNEYWNSDHEIESEKLFQLRQKMAAIEEKLWQVHRILNNEE